MSDKSRPGWAIRRYIPNGSRCPENEVGYNTWGDWYACCPKDTASNGTGGNTYCDKGSATKETGPQAQCANTTWSMWAHDGYFCCEQNLMGYYWEQTDSVGCTSEAWVNEAKENNTGAYDATSATNPPASQKSTNTGAIAGGVVGGVCGALLIAAILWFVCRRRRRSKAPKTSTEIPTTYTGAAMPAGSHYERIPIELGEEGLVDRKPELPETTRPRQELSSDHKQPPAELA